MKPTDEFLVALKALLGRHFPLDEDEIDLAHESGGDGNFNDSLDWGIRLGESSLADEVRGLMHQHGIDPLA